MSFLGGIFGSTSGNSGKAGLNYSADYAPIQQGVTLDTIGNANNQVNSAIQGQSNFVNDLSAQRGLQNQNNLFQQQQNLARQYQNIANGVGPNPALQQLQNTTAQNMANQSAMMAGQRGSNANAGMIARQAGMQGANTQQQAVGQAAVLQAQQQLSGMSGLQAQQGMMGNLANQQVAQQQQGLLNYNQAAQSEQQNLLNALAQYNNANVGMQSNVNNANAGISAIQAKNQGQVFGGLMAGAGDGMALMGAKGGMVVQSYADGGSVSPPPPAPAPAPTPPPQNKPASQVGQYFSLFSSAPGQSNAGQASVDTSSGTTQDNSVYKGSEKFGQGAASGLQGLLGGGGEDAADAADAAGDAADVTDASSGAGDLLDAGAMAAAHGGSVPQIPHYDSGGMIKLAASIAPLLMALLSKGGPVQTEQLATEGKTVPGKAVVKGDSLKNDRVPALLSPKEIVIPRSITMSKNAPEKAKQFVAAVLAKQGMGARK